MYRSVGVRQGNCIRAHHRDTPTAIVTTRRRHRVGSVNAGGSCLLCDTLSVAHTTVSQTTTRMDTQSETLVTTSPSPVLFEVDVPGGCYEPPPWFCSIARGFDHL